MSFLNLPFVEFRSVRVPTLWISILRFLIVMTPSNTVVSSLMPRVHGSSSGMDGWYQQRSVCHSPPIRSTGYRGTSSRTGPPIPVPSSLKILCRDARRTKPVDLHFLTLPLSDGNLTISRSPLRDSDYQNFFKYQVGTGSNEVAWNGATNSWTDGNATTYFNSSNQVTAEGRTYLMSKLGYRYATSTELIKAREAATPGTTNKWTAIRPIEPLICPTR